MPRSKYDFLLPDIEGLILPGRSLEETLQDVCDYLVLNIDHYHWAGFYIADNHQKILELGPFCGEPTEHVKIPFGKGICGQSAETKDIYLVQDVAKETNYLSCSLKVKSEIVIPIIKNDVYLAQLDIDSHNLAPFSDHDKIFLNKICDKLIPFFK